jgi:hypothetical protein
LPNHYFAKAQPRRGQNKLESQEEAARREESPVTLNSVDLFDQMSSGFRRVGHNNSSLIEHD